MARRRVRDRGRRCRPTSWSATSQDATAPGSKPRSPGFAGNDDGRRISGSTYVPADDSCFCRFEAETADDVRDANEIAGVPFARIVAAEEIVIGQPGLTQKGDRS